MAAVNTTWMRFEALGVLEEWLAGYTSGNEVQHKIILNNVDQRSGALTVSVVQAGVFPGEPKRFIVDVTVRKAKTE